MSEDRESGIGNRESGDGEIGEKREKREKREMKLMCSDNFQSWYSLDHTYKVQSILFSLLAAPYSLLPNDSHSRTILAQQCPCTILPTGKQQRLRPQRPGFVLS
ncbi:MAG: hypothetical protein F6K65_10140 [Moorea sp. SIO3C2]|nr:hypothetical protein [Moorena sp. SIO3C2]